MRQTKPTAAKHQELDKKIRQLLLFSVDVPIHDAKSHLDKLGMMTLKEKQDIIDLLSENYYNLRKDGKLIMPSIKRHVQRWEQTFGPVSTDDIRELLKDANLSIMDVFPHKVSPLLIETWLRQYLIGQPDYARKLALTFFLHKLRMDETNLSLPRTNLLVHGPSGTGKTYGAQRMAQFFHIPFGVVNCNSLVQEGIEGIVVTDVLTRLYKVHKEETRHAVILFDEFDKLFESGYYNERVINELLNIIDDNNIVTFRKSDERYNYEKATMSTNKMLFIFTGVFKGLEDIVRRRIGERHIGFSQPATDGLSGDFHQYATEEDFARFFQRSELSGRIQQYACVNELQAGDLVDILLHTKDSPAIGYMNYFKMRGIDLVVTRDGASAIASAACERHLGVRGLKSLMLKILTEDMIMLDNERIVVDEKYVLDKIA